MRSITAIFENGIFRPLEPVDLPEHSRVEFEPRLQGQAPEAQPPTAGDQRIREVLSRRYHSGHHDTAERHNEHQP
jgi:predicted DNA-binding antitoxin AbrB/MazE fold protein